MKTTATNFKVRQIISMLKQGELIPRPEFQRRLVWTNDDKIRFLETVLQEYPFPEIYICDGDVNLQTAVGTRLLVDGQQRVNTIYEYFTGDPRLMLGHLSPYATLDPQEQAAFLGYDIAVRDLGTLSKEQVIEVFKRINSTNYSLNAMEINNAIYEGRLKKFAEAIAAHGFFEAHSIFRRTDYTRMGDLRFVLSIVITYLQGYFNREEAFQESLDRLNDDFPNEREIQSRMYAVMDFIEECGFSTKSRIWKKADLFTVFVEMDVLLCASELPQPSYALAALSQFYEEVDVQGADGGEGPIFTYYKAALQASNDRLNRVRRGVIINAVLRGKSFEDITDELKAGGLL